VTIKAMTATM